MTDLGSPKDIVSRRSELIYYAAAVALGTLTGMIGTVLHLGVNQLLQWPEHLRASLAWGEGWLLLLAGLISATMVVTSVWLVRRFAPETGGSGVQEIEGAMEGLRHVRWVRALLVKFFGGFLSLGSGLVLGREGPTIHMGASVAQGLSEGLRLPQQEARGLLAAGAAAGLAAAFSAPIASILFVIEETRRQFPYSMKTYTAVMLAAFAAGVVTEKIAGIQPFMRMNVPDMPLAFLAAFAGLGVFLGIAGAVFNKVLVWSLDHALILGKRTSFYLLPAVVGFAVGVLLLLYPDATMGGEGLVIALVQQPAVIQIILALVVVRFVMTMASYSTGVPGGIFAPILALATALGILYALALEMVMPLPEGAAIALAVAAMGGLFTACIRAPLVGIVLVAELTGAYTAMVPTMITCILANLVADWMGGRPIYEVLLERTLRLAGKPVPAEHEKTVGLAG